MRSKLIILLSLLVTVFVLSASTVLQEDKEHRNTTGNVKTTHWYKGNTHAHSRYTDKSNENDVPEVAKWYRKEGYNFLVISEHDNLLAKRRVICHDEASRPPEFIMLCGLELSERHHLTAFGIDKYIKEGKSVQEGVTSTVDAGGIPILNHPEEPVFSAKEFIGTKGLNHFEVFNGNHPRDTQACEQLWDSVMSDPAGRIIYAVASDDSHYSKADVGRGWIMVDSPRLTKEDIEQSVRAGKFYASTGIVITEYSVKNNIITVETENGATIRFIGRYGKVLRKAEGTGASYKIKGDESYIRIKITNKGGFMAWTQPVVVKKAAK